MTTWAEQHYAPDGGGRRLYLDVDGVINALPYETRAQHYNLDVQYPSAWGDEWKTQHVTYGWEGAAHAALTWSPSFVEVLNEALAHPDGPTLWWTTTWQLNAQEVIEPTMGIDPGPRGSHIISDQGKGVFLSGGSIMWKVANLHDRMTSYPLTAPWVHFEDELVFDDNRAVQLWKDFAPKNNGLAIAPNEDYGISPADWQRAVNHWGLQGEIFRTSDT